jgi:hypothetical protein
MGLKGLKPCVRKLSRPPLASSMASQVKAESVSLWHHKPNPDRNRGSVRCAQRLWLAQIFQGRDLGSRTAMVPGPDQAKIPMASANSIHASLGRSSAPASWLEVP